MGLYCKLGFVTNLTGILDHKYLLVLMDTVSMVYILVARVFDSITTIVNLIGYRNGLWEN